MYSPAPHAHAIAIKGFIDPLKAKRLINAVLVIPMDAHVADIFDRWCASAAGMVHGLTTSEPQFVDRDFVRTVTKFLRTKSVDRTHALANRAQARFEAVLCTEVQIDFVGGSPGLFYIWMRADSRRFVFYSCLDGPADSADVVVCIRADNTPAPMEI
jgi:hypothetical protein